MLLTNLSSSLLPRTWQVCTFWTPVCRYLRSSLLTDELWAEVMCYFPVRAPLEFSFSSCRETCSIVCLGPWETVISRASLPTCKNMQCGQERNFHYFELRVESCVFLQHDLDLSDTLEPRTSPLEKFQWFTIHNYFSEDAVCLTHWILGQNGVEIIRSNPKALVNDILPNSQEQLRNFHWSVLLMNKRSWGHCRKKSLCVYDKNINKYFSLKLMSF